MDTARILHYQNTWYLKHIISSLLREYNRILASAIFQDGRLREWLTDLIADARLNVWTLWKQKHVNGLFYLLEKYSWKSGKKPNLYLTATL